jgi:hypothetical protein
LAILEGIMNSGSEESTHKDIVEETENEKFDEECGDIQVEQDSFRHVMFGQLADGLLPPCKAPQGSDEDELSRAALSDPDASTDEGHQYQPTAWRVIFLLVVAAAALAIVFWK